MKRILLAGIAGALIAGQAVSAPVTYPPHNWITPADLPGSKASRINYLDGNKLLEYCETQTLGCSLYIEGVADGQLSATLGTSRTIAYCIPTGSTARQVMDVVVKYLRDRPAQRNELASTIVANALADAWPQCQ